ncbi:MAG TPA: AbrB/MazE/SpoVT family DNA-binding domain-containing protein [Vicinamibacterales bacterium]|nr:AbrB/MazE/SpoVT family DNA-binding domain-containing protein [Vicinamibacterales bacterium]
MYRTTIAKVTSSGQISLPAAVRRRWRTARVAVDDEGDRVTVRPLPDDPVSAACGSLRRNGSSEAIRARERRLAAAREARRRAR